MSWDLFVQDIPPAARGIDDIPANFEPRALGLRGDVIRRIQEVVPTADFGDPSWGSFDAPNFSVEFNMGNAGPIDCFAMHVRGKDAAAGFVADLLLRCGWRAFDPASESGIFDPATALASLQRWRAYRDHAIGADMDTTARYYHEHADEYAQTAVGLTPTRAWDFFCGALSPGARILDLGCGPGRDVLEFAKRGFEVVGVDSSPSMVAIARRHTNADIRIADFSELDFPAASFDGVWAMASLLHLRRSAIARVLERVRRLLTADGILFTAMRDGSGSEVDADGRFFERYSMAEWTRLVGDAGFTIVSSYETESGKRNWHVTLARLGVSTNEP